MRGGISKSIGRSLILLAITLGWILLQSSGALQSLENLSQDWRFRQRGALKAPDVKLIYVNLDQDAVSAWGEKPFPRGVLAEGGRAALELGGAKALFYDFIFSEIAPGRMIPQEVIHAQDAELSRLVQDHGDRIVLASAFTGLQPGFMDVPSILPLVKDSHYDKKHNPIPELPAYPIYNPRPDEGGFTEKSWGRTAFINVSLIRGTGATLRYLPTYVEVENEYFATAYLYNLVAGLRRDPALGAMARQLSVPEKSEDGKLQLTSVEGHVLETVPTIVPKTFVTPAIQLLMIEHGLEDETRAVVPSEDGKRLTVLDYRNHDALLYSLPLLDRQMLEINWFSPWRSAPESRLDKEEDLTEAAFQEQYGNESLSVRQAHYLMILAKADLADPHNPKISLRTLVDLATLAGEDAEAHEIIEPWLRRHFADRFVFMGPTDPIMQDVAPTPLDPNPVPRVSAHGNALKTILTGSYITRLPSWSSTLLILILAMGAGELARGSSTGRRGVRAGSILLLSGYAGAAILLFNTSNVMLPLVAPVGAALTTSMAGLAMQLRDEKQRRLRIKGMFATYLAPELVDQMLASGREPQLGGTTAEITALFSDIQNFTMMSEVMPPADLVELMNEYLTAMTEVVQANGGTLDKYVGDAMVVMFGAPLSQVDHASRACRAAALMQERQETLRKKWEHRGERWAPLVRQMQTRIGLSTGPATVGNMGSQVRFNYTMMGDTVNLAARCESGAKAAGVLTLITEATKAAAEQHSDEVVFRRVDKWQVSGRREPVWVYEIMGLKSSVSDTTIECAALYESALDAYFSQDWGTAISILERSARLEPRLAGQIVHSTPSLILLERCRAMQLNPPGSNWDGVHVMKMK